MSGMNCKLERLVRLTPETPRWKKMGACLDSIGEAWEEAVNPGFVTADDALLCEQLRVIENAARRARRIMQPNNQADALEKAQEETK